MITFTIQVPDKKYAYFKLKEVLEEERLEFTERDNDAVTELPIVVSNGSFTCTNDIK